MQPSPSSVAQTSSIRRHEHGFHSGMDGLQWWHTEPLVWMGASHGLCIAQSLCVDRTAGLGTCLNFSYLLDCFVYASTLAFALSFHSSDCLIPSYPFLFHFYIFSPLLLSRSVSRCA
ncbi:hypothetical protein K469DRAFT_89978 [Zopfia rhizophila CBS 207.26]|uniref:Uncharacterized protein n=1 Tax=Zopfia rhizophila CBS 207.26 TaxID=1314779 RepID=A0A6A6EC64_9PEZI|nr:hypothetical protein K469DRAFT_89978 [Zopfia rhizophila CBS 207.26]